MAALAGLLGTSRSGSRGQALSRAGALRFEHARESRSASITCAIWRPKREQSITAAVLRSLWDQDRANVMTRSQPLAVKGAHLSIISHVTAAELRRELTEVDTVNGFANRFLFAYVERSKVLPYGGYVPEHELDQLADRLGEAIDKDWGHETIIFDAGARALWEESYPTLTEDRPGLHGAATARSEAQVIRHALDLLETLKLIRREPVPTGGRPKERIHLRSLKEIDP